MRDETEAGEPGTPQPPATSGQPGMLALPETLDLRAAAPLAAELAARRGLDVSLDASRVGRLGAQCLQVLLSARACWEGDGARFTVIAPSDSFLDGVTLLGAASLLPTNQA